MAETPDAALEPILIAGALSLPAANGARHVALADGEWRGEALAFDRVFLPFDNRRIDDARATWKTLGAGDGVQRHYLKQDDRTVWSGSHCSKETRRRFPRYRVWGRRQLRTCRNRQRR